MNTFAKGICFFACLICVGGIPTQVSPATPKQQAHLMKVFSEAVAMIRQKTSVPIRIPTEVPDLDNGEDDDLYAIVKSVDETGYTVVLGATPDCEGQHVCSYGTLIGTTRPFNEITDYGLTDRRKRRAILWNGIRGYFYDSVCRAYCSDSLIVWTEGKYRYIIGLKAEKQSNMIKVANSAIRAGTDRWK